MIDFLYLYCSITARLLYPPAAPNHHAQSPSAALLMRIAKKNGHRASGIDTLLLVTVIASAFFLR